MRQYGLEEREEWIVEDRTSGTMEIIEPKLPKDMPTAFVCNCDQTASVLIHELERKRLPCAGGCFSCWL